MQPAKEKKIIYKDRRKFGCLVVISCVLCIIALLNSNYYVFGFFALCGMVEVYPLINPRNKVIWIGTKEFKEAIAAESTEKFNAMGIFTYTGDGFSILMKSKTEQHKWTDITSMIAYKRDDLTTDCICMDVFCSDGLNFSITEDTLGWYVFLKKTKEQFPHINKLWDLEITTPAFKKNLTLVYDREGRALEEVMGVSYPKK